MANRVLWAYCVRKIVRFSASFFCLYWWTLWYSPLWFYLSIKSIIHLLLWIDLLFLLCSNDDIYSSYMIDMIYAVREMSRLSPFASDHNEVNIQKLDFFFFFCFSWNCFFVYCKRIFYSIFFWHLEWHLRSSWYWCTYLSYASDCSIVTCWNFLAECFPSLVLLLILFLLSCMRV